jgi:hypothetical protein
LSVNKLTSNGMPVGPELVDSVEGQILPSARLANVMAAGFDNDGIEDLADEIWQRGSLAQAWRYHTLGLG